MSARRQRVTPARPLWQRLAGWYMARPRWARILVAGLFGIALTLLVSPVVDRIYLDYFFSVETRVVPSLVTTAVGILWYIVGWRLTMSVEAEDTPPLRSIAWYLLIGIMVVLLVVVLIVVGLVTGNAPT